MTNREWLMSLSDKQLAEFCTFGISVHDLWFDSNDKISSDCIINVKDIAGRYIDSIIGLEKWLQSPQEFVEMKLWRQNKQ